MIDLANPAQQFWLLGLLILWALLLFGGFAFGKPNAERTRRMPAWTRIGSSLALVAAAWSWYLFTLGTAVSALSLCLAIGMTLGCLGDLCLAGALALPQPVLGGIAAFGLGHVAYIIGLLLFGNQQHLDAPAPRWVAWLIWLLIGLAGWYLVVWRGGKHTILHRAALPYALLLASTAGVATGLAWQAPAFIPLAIGAALFLVSDLILAAQLFNHRHFLLIGDVIWLTYGPAQVLIVYSVASALLVVGK
ncbi:MAG TPA: lysoplasmalogenase family protein [Ktedonobacterales bacterium]|nr:lysoplasmalogenase family protein [Ktedonobacterales bacterium]